MLEFKRKIITQSYLLKLKGIELKINKKKVEFENLSKLYEEKESSYKSLIDEKSSLLESKRTKTEQLNKQCNELESKSNDLKTKIPLYKEDILGLESNIESLKQSREDSIYINWIEWLDYEIVKNSLLAIKNNLREGIKELRIYHDDLVGKIEIETDKLESISLKITNSEEAWNKREEDLDNKAKSLSKKEQNIIIRERRIRTIYKDRLGKDIGEI